MTFIKEGISGAEAIRRIARALKPLKKRSRPVRLTPELDALRLHLGGSFDDPDVTARLRLARRRARGRTSYGVVPAPCEPPEYDRRYGAPQLGDDMR